MKKRILCLLLAAIMIVPLFASTVSAETDAPYAEVTSSKEMLVYFGDSRPAIGTAAGQTLSWIQLYDGNTRVSYGAGYVNYPVWIFWVDEANGIAKATDVWGAGYSLTGMMLGTSKIYKTDGTGLQDFTLNDIKANGHPNAEFKLNLNLSGDQNAEGTVIEIKNNYPYGVVNDENSALIYFGNYTPSTDEIPDDGQTLNWVQMYDNGARVSYNSDYVNYPVWLKWYDKANNIAQITPVWGTTNISLFDMMDGTGFAYAANSDSAGTKTVNEIATAASASNWEFKLNMNHSGDKNAEGYTITLKQGQSPIATVTGDNELTIDFGDVKVSGIGTAAGQTLSWIQLYNGDSRVSYGDGYVNYPVWVYWTDEANNIAKATDVWGKDVSLPGMLLGTAKLFKSDGTGLQNFTLNDIREDGYPNAEFKLNLNLSGDQGAQGRVINIDANIPYVLVNDDNSALVYFGNYIPSTDEIPDEGNSLNWVQMYDKGSRVSYNDNLVNYPVWLEWYDKANNIAKITPVWGTENISLYDMVAGTGLAYDHATAAAGTKTVNEIATETNAVNWEFKLNLNHSGDCNAEGYKINLILENTAKATVTSDNELTIDFGNSRPEIGTAAGQTLSWIQLYDGDTRVTYEGGFVNYPVWVYWTDKDNGIAKATDVWGKSVSLNGLMLGTSKVYKSDGTSLLNATLNDIKADGHPNAEFKLNLNLSGDQSVQGKIIDIDPISYGVVNNENSALIYFGNYTPSTDEIPDDGQTLNWVQMYDNGARVSYNSDYVNYPVWLKWYDKANNIAQITPVWGTTNISLFDMMDGTGFAYAANSDSAGTKTVNEIATATSASNWEFKLNMNHSGDKNAEGHTVTLKQGTVPTSKVISEYKTLIYFNDYVPTADEVPDSGSTINWIQLYNEDGTKVVYEGNYVNYPVWVKWYNKTENIAIATPVWDSTATMSGYADGTGLAYDYATATAGTKTVNEIRTLTSTPNSKFYINLNHSGDVNAIGTLIPFELGTLPTAQVVNNDKILINLNDYEASAEEIPVSSNSLNWMILYDGTSPVMYDGRKVAFPVFLSWENKSANTVNATAVWGASATIGGYVSGKAYSWNEDGTALLDVTIDEIIEECNCENAQFKVILNHSGDRNADGTAVPVSDYIMPYAEIINRSEMLIHFNSMVVTDADIADEKFIQYLKLQEDYTSNSDMIMDAENGIYCQFGGIMTWYDKDNNIMKYTYAQGDGQSLLDVYDGTVSLPIGGTKTLNDWASGHQNSKLRFNFNGNWIDVICTYDIENVPHAEIISDYQMLIHFKDMVVSDDDMKGAANNSVHYLKLQATPVDSDMIYDLENEVFCQFGGIVEWYDKDNNIAIYTYAQGDDKKLNDIYNLTECPANSDKTLKEWAEGYPNAELRFNFNGTWMDVINTSVPMVESEYPHMISATATGFYTMEVEFSEPITINGNPFIALRIMDSKDNLVWNEDGMPLQFPGLWEYANAEHTKIKFTMYTGGFAVYVKNISDVINRTGNLAEYAQYSTKFVIEEAYPDMRDTEDGTVDNVISNITGKKLWANKVNPGVNCDSAVVSISENYQYPSFYLKKATAINESQILLEFTQPMKLDVANPFMALRIVTDNNDLQVGEYNGKIIPLQWYGTFELYNPERTILLWTIGPESRPYGMGNVYDILNLTGDLEQYAEKGYMTKFCIEELFPLNGKDTEDGTVANFRADDGTHLYANKVMEGDSWDGVYIDVDIDPNYVVTTVNTGDTINLPVCISLVVLSACAVTFIVVRRRRKITH